MRRAHVGGRRPLPSPSSSVSTVDSIVLTRSRWKPRYDCAPASESASCSARDARAMRRSRHHRHRHRRAGREQQRERRAPGRSTPPAPRATRRARGDPVGEPVDLALLRDRRLELVVQLLDLVDDLGCLGDALDGRQLGARARRLPTSPARPRPTAPADRRRRAA